MCFVHAIARQWCGLARAGVCPACETGRSCPPFLSQSHGLGLCDFWAARGVASGCVHPEAWLGAGSLRLFSPCNLVFWLHLGLGCTLCDSPRLGPLAIVVVFLCAAPRQRLLVFLLFDTLVALILYSPQVCTLATPRGSTPSSFGHGALAPPRAPRGYMIAPLGGTVLIEPVCVD